MTHTSVATDRFTENEFRVGSVISRSASVLSRHFPTYFIVALVASLPTPLLDDPMDLALNLLGALVLFPDAMRGAMVAQALSALPWAVPAFVLQFVFSMIGQAVILHAAFQDMRRRPVRLAQSLTIGLRRLLPVIGLALVASSLILLGSIFLIIPGLILYTMWFVAVAACVVERLGPWRSMRRSQELTKGHRWKLFGLALLLLIPGLGSSLIGSGLTEIAGDIAGLVGYLIWTAFWAAVSSVVVAVTYHDLRVAKEGVDIEQIAAVFDGAPG